MTMKNFETMDGNEAVARVAFRLENRFKMLSQSRPEEAKLLFKQAQQNLNARWQHYHRLAENGSKEKEKVS